jgi:hypothetical protein
MIIVPDRVISRHAPGAFVGLLGVSLLFCSLGFAEPEYENRWFEIAGGMLIFLCGIVVIALAFELALIGGVLLRALRLPQANYSAQNRRISTLRWYLVRMASVAGVFFTLSVGAFLMWLFSTRMVLLEHGPEDIAFVAGGGAALILGCVLWWRLHARDLL